MDEHVTLRVNYDNEDAILSLVSCFKRNCKMYYFHLSKTFPVVYRELLREIRSTFQIGSQSERLIVHYESGSIRRPLTGADDFDLLLQFQFHLRRAPSPIALFVSVDSSLPNLEASSEVGLGTLRDFEI